MASIKHFVDIDLNKNQLTNVSLQHLSGDPSGTGDDFEGRIFYDSASGGKVVKFHNGTEFLALSVGAGDVTGVTAGAGMTGTDLTGPVPVLNVIGGDGITANANDVAITAAQTTITSVTNAALVLARDAHNQIKFGTDNQIIFRVGNADNVIMKASGEIEATSLDVTDADISGNLTGLNNITSTNYIIGGHTVDDIDITSEFVDADAHIMSSKAIGARFAQKNADTTGTATNSVHVLVTDNEDTDEENQVTFIEGAGGGGAQRGLEADGNFTYNPSSGTVSSTRFAGNFVIGGHVIDDVDIAGEFVDSAAHLLTSAAALDKFHVLNADTSGTATNATNAAHVLVTDNENTDEENQITFVEGAGGGGANRGLEADGHLTYNPSSGTVSATIFKGNIDAVDGDFDGTLEADALTVGGTNVLTGSLITTLGTISAGVWNGTAIASQYLDADTAHLTTAQTFTGSKTMGTNVKLNFRDGNSFINSNAANDIEVVATTITLDAGSDIQLEGNTTVTGNFSVSGTLNVDGSTTTIDSTTVAIADSMLKLAKDQNNTTDAVDFGFYGQYGVSGTHKFAGIFRDLSVSGDPFTFFDSLQAEPGATVNTGGTGYDLADISAGGITAADGFVGDLEGDASGSAGTVTSIGNLTGDVTSSNRATTIGAGKVHHAMLADDIISGQAALTALAQDDIFAVHDTSASAVKKITYTNLEDDIFGNISGNATVAAGGALTIAADAVTYAKMQNVSATNVVLGRDSSGAGIVEEISAANLRTMINVENGATADQSKGDIDGLAITTVGTLDTGNATAIVSAASRTAAGIAERATPTEALAGSDDARYVSPLGLAALSKKFTIGDGSDVDITLTHNLGTRDVIVQMYDASSYETIVAEVVRTDANNITVNTNTALANNDCIVLVQKIF